MIAALSWDPSKLALSLFSSTSKKEESKITERSARAKEHLDPFQRSARIRRSAERAEQSDAEDTRSMDCESIVSESVASVCSESVASVVSIPESDVFRKLGREIKKLVVLLEDGKRRSINQAMRDAIESAKALYELSAIQFHDERAKEVIRTNCAAQTTPGLVKRRREKGQKDVTPETRQRAKKQKAVEEPQAPITPINGETVPERQWKKVTRKGRKKPETVPKETPKEAKKPDKARERKRARPDAIVIEAKDKESYAAILRTFKSNPDMADIGEAVSRIRRTQKGSMLLLLKEKEARTAEFRSRISNALGKDADVKALEQRAEVLVKDIDEVTTKDEIIEAIKAQFEEEVKPEHVYLRKSFGETQTASISLQLTGAAKLVKAGKMKIGWVVCRIREKTEVTKCFRCLEFGHIARNCKNEDRTKRCRRCGEDGHVAKSCKKEPSCMFCRKNNLEETRHVAGSGGCPTLKKALASRK